MPLTGPTRRGPPCPVARAPRAGCCPAGSAGCLPPPRGARRPHRGHRRLAACPQTWPAVPPASAAARGRRPGALLPGAWTPRFRRWCAHRVPLMPAAGSGRDAVPGPAPEDRPAPPPGPPGAGMVPARPSPAPSPPWPGSGGAAPGIPGAAGMAWRDWRGPGCRCLLRAAVSPHRPSRALSGFFRIMAF